MITSRLCDEAKVIVREYKNNLDKLTRNYNIGKELTLAGKHYGEGIVKKCKYFN